MSDQDRPGHVTFGGAAMYRITVQGRVPTGWKERLAGMSLRVETGRSDKETHSVLEGLLRDQSELNGVLDVLYTLHLPIVRVEQLEQRSS